MTHRFRSRAALLGLVVATVLVWGPAAVGAELVPAGPERLVPERRDSQQQTPAVAASGDDLLVAWSHFDADALDVRSRVFAGPAGVPGPEIAVSPPTTGVLDVEVVAAAGGGWWVGWLDVLDGGVEVRRLGADGRPAGPVIPVAGPAAGFRMALAAAEDGGLLVAWQDGTSRALVARRLDADGVPAGPPREVSADPDEVHGGPAAVALPGGGFYLAWEGSSRETRIYGRRLRPDGRPTGEPTPLAPEPLGPQREPALAADADGGLLVAWMQTVGAGTPGIPQPSPVAAARLLFPGVAATPIVHLTEEESAAPAAAALPGGGFLVAWAERSERGVPRVRARVVSAAGEPAGTGFPLSSRASEEEPSHVTDPELVPALTVAADGSVVAAWQRGIDLIAPPATWSDIPDVLMRRFLPTGTDRVRFTASALAGSEGRRLRFTVERTGPLQGGAAVEVVAHPAAALGAAGPVARLEWADGEGGPKTAEVELPDDRRRREPPERFDLVLVPLTSGLAVGAPGTLAVTILDDEGPAAAAAEPVSVPLGGAEVACAADRLAGWHDRFAIAPRPAGPSGLALAATGAGAPSGLAWRGGDPPGDEVQLAFTLIVEETELLDNPARPPLPAVHLVRVDPASDLTGGEPRLAVGLDPTLDGDFSHPQATLAIDDRRTAAGRPADSGPGRGLGRLTETCHRPLGEGDRHVLFLLQRLVRAEAPGADRVAVSLYRTAPRNEFAVELAAWSGGTRTGHLEALLRIEWAETGPGRPALAGGTLVPLSGDGDLELLLVRPATPDQPSEVIHRVPVPPPAGAPEPLTVDWGELLAGTAWLRPA